MAASIDGFNRANGAQEKPSAPSDEEYVAAVDAIDTISQK